MIIQILTGTVVVAAITQVLKLLLEAAGLHPSSTWHDPIIWLIALAVGVGGYLLHAETVAPLVGQTAWDAAGQGFLAALSAVGTYHLVTHTLLDATSPPPPARPANAPEARVP